MDDNGDDNNDKDTMIASMSKNHNNHNVIFFAPLWLLLWQQTMVEPTCMGVR
jgi:hypothetical protein